MVKISRIGMISVHTSPLAPLGGKKTGGMNVYVRELARELARRGIEVDIFTRRSAPNTPEIDTSLGEGVRVITIPAGPVQPMDPDAIFPHLSQFAAGIIAYVTRTQRQYDVIYSHYWLSGWVAHKLKEVWKTPFVHMFHTLGHMKNRIGTGPVSIPDVRITVETQIVSWADRIIAATPAEHAQLLWLYRADRRKITIVPPGVDPQRFRPIPQPEAKAQLNIPDKDKLLLFVGRIEPLKAVDTILEALKLIKIENPDLLTSTRCAIIGGDPDSSADTELTRLRELCCAMNLDEVVDFLGAKDHKMLPLYYAAASAVIVPSDYESFGMVALEAMAAGTPVIASEVGGLAFLVQDHMTGFLIPVRDAPALANAMTRLLCDPEIRFKLGQNAAELAQHYIWPRIVNQLLPVFESVAFRPPAVSVSPRKR